MSTGTPSCVCFARIRPRRPSPSLFSRRRRCPRRSGAPSRPRSPPLARKVTSTARPSSSWSVAPFASFPPDPQAISLARWEGRMTDVAARDLLGTELREVIRSFEAMGELRHVDEADPHLELGAITEMMALREGPALLFDHLPGYAPGYRVLSNLLNCPRRVAALFGHPSDVGGIALVRAIRERFSSLQLIDPVTVSRADFAEETERGDDVNLLKFPAPFWHEHDGGRYIGTGCSVIMRDPVDGWVNLG